MNAAQRGWQGASVGAVSAKTLLVFVLARTVLDLATVRAAVERRPPERSGVGKDAQPTAGLLVLPCGPQTFRDTIQRSQMKTLLRMS